MLCMFYLSFIFSVIKLSLPNIGDFELFFNQVAQLIEGGCQQQIQSQGVDKCMTISFYLVILGKRQTQLESIPGLKPPLRVLFKWTPIVFDAFLE